ncbi:hypothetical protein KIN20_022472 [Parelaphostrongylus tenuis]|uniref:Uncharacterized protein n=1 Tax=Parelaphostrongylus tenuis TaxID=148309 RepID=A0AAD5N914_PARTN|nr:hypothetical protein KIN20_022472 [Parelaphostrongylus tenuis]
MGDPPSCIIMSNTVTGICTSMNVDPKACMEAPNMMVTTTAINDTYSTISGTLSTTNIVMANWPKGDVAKCAEQSGSNAGIGSIWFKLLLGFGNCWRKLKFNCEKAARFREILMKLDFAPEAQFLMSSPSHRCVGYLIA